MPKAELRIADEFVYDIAAITLERVLAEIRETVSLLATAPEMGLPSVRASLKRAFGPNLRKLPVSSFIIVYRYEGGVVDVLACVCGPRVR